MEKYYAITKEGHDDLKHWKYIKRKWDFDKRRYVYTYANTKTKNIPAFDKAEEIKNHIKDKMGYDEHAAYKTMKNTVKMHKSMIDLRNKTRRDILAGYEKWYKTPKSKRKEIVKHLIDVDNAMEKKELKNARKVCKKALKEYRKTPLYKLRKAKKKINRGARWFMKTIALGTRR